MRKKEVAKFNWKSYFY